MTIQIFDNFLNDKNLEKLESLLYSDNFSWFLSDSMTYDVNKGFKSKIFNVEKNLLFHTFYTKENSLGINSNHFDFIANMFPFCNNLDNLYQIRGNLVMHSGIDFRHTTYHVDMYENESTREKNPIKGAVTAIYYLHGNTSPTIFKTGKLKRKLVFPRKNRMVIFPNETLHAHYLPVNKKRIVINFNLYSNF